MQIRKFPCYVLVPLLLILLLSLTACTNRDEPTIKATLTVSKLSDRNFQEIGTKNVTKEDFRKVNLTLRIRNCKDRNVTMPNIRDTMNSYDIERYWYGESSKNDNVALDYAEYTYDIMFLSKGLDNNGIESVFNNHDIIVTWTDHDGKIKEKSIDMAEILTMK